MILIILILGNIFNQLPMSTIFAIKYSSDLCEILRNVFGIETFKGFHFKYFSVSHLLKLQQQLPQICLRWKHLKDSILNIFSVSHLLKLQQQLHVRC